ncbi:unnamed protein product [Lota lota]
MCVVKRPEEQYKILFQPSDPPNLTSCFQVRGRRLNTQLPLDRPQNSQDALQGPGSARRGHRRKGGAEAVGVSGAGGPSQSPVAMVTITDCVDNGTQTEISFQNLLTLGRGARGGRRPHDPSTSYHLGPCDLHPLVLDGNHGDCVNVSQHGEDPHRDLEYEEVSLYKSSLQEKLGLTVCYRTDEEEQEDQGIYVGEINGVDVHNRDEAVAILSRVDSVNLFLLLARPESAPHSGDARPSSFSFQQEAGEGEEEEERGDSGDHLGTSPELDSGVGRTEESSDLLEQSNTCYTTTSSTPGSLAMLSPRPSSSPGQTQEGPTPTPTLLHLQDLQLSSDSPLGLDWASGPRYSPHHHQPSLSMMTMVPGLTEEECERYQELLEIKCQYERTGVAARSSRLLLAQEKARGARDGGVPKEEEEEEQEVLSQREVALIEEELRHLEFKCRSILRAQKMQQLRERCLKT